MATTTPSVRLKAIALPPEHGAWGFLLEPIVLGLLVAPSLAVFLTPVAITTSSTSNRAAIAWRVTMAGCWLDTAPEYFTRSTRSA